MRIEFHNLPLCGPFEYWCGQCQTLNLSFVPLTHCPSCANIIIEKGEIGQLKTKTEREIKGA